MNDTDKRWLDFLVMTLCKKTGCTFEDALKQILGCIKSWLEHPDCEKTHDQNPWYTNGYGKTPDSSFALGVFEHEPGHELETKSFVVSSLHSIFTSIAWGERTLGRFIGIRPYPHKWEVDPFMTIRITYLSYSYKGGGKSYAARMKLKEMLPRKLRPLIQATRKAYSKPKHMHLYHFYDNPEDAKKAIVQDRVHKYPSRQPKKYRQSNKRQILLMYWLTEEQRRTLSIYIDPLEFVKAATGFYHPTDVPMLINHQLELLETA